VRLTILQSSTIMLKPRFCTVMFGTPILFKLSKLLVLDKLQMKWKGMHWQPGSDAQGRVVLSGLSSSTFFALHICTYLQHLSPCVFSLGRLLLFTPVKITVPKHAFPLQYVHLSNNLKSSLRLWNFESRNGALHTLLTSNWLKHP
jgi:hypothetical protein